MRDLSQGNEARLIVSFSIPLLIGNIFQQLYSTVDAMAVGIRIGKEALAAVGVSGPILFLMISVIMGITMGGGVVLSQYYGAKDFKRLRAAMHSTYFFLLLASVAVTIIGVAFSGPILALIGTPKEYLEPAKTFLTITFLGMFFVFGYNAISAVLRSLGDSRTPLYFLILASVLNIGLVILFVFGLNWGIAGSAWATVIAQGVAFVISLIYVQRSGNKVLRISLRELRWHKEEMGKVLAMSLPTTLQMGLVALSFVALNAMVKGFGTNVMAGFTAAGRLDAFAILPAMNLSMAMTTFVGQNIGAGRMDRVARGLRATLLLSGVLSVAISLTFLVFPHQLIGLFENDPEVLRNGAEYLRIVSPFYILFSGMFVFTGLLRGAGAATFSMVATIVAVWAARVPASWVLSQFFGPQGIWWGIPIGWTFGLCMVVAYWASGRWKKLDVIGRKPQLHVAPTADELAHGCMDGDNVGAEFIGKKLPC